VLLDTYINRRELPPPPGEADLRRSPIDVQELLDLHPEAIFLGHGHGDHADNAAYIAKWPNCRADRSISFRECAGYTSNPSGMKFERIPGRFLLRHQNRRSAHLITHA
jgi:glyoxylase-like metal-dependent hydrolase (beta-lactamase superfamily II)